MEVSIIILSYNTSELTEKCVESIYKFTKDISFEVVVLDNASKDNSVAALQKFKKHKNFKLILSKVNHGFTKGNNLASKKAKGKYLLFLNSDTLFEGNVLKGMLQFFDSHEDAGVATCSLLNKDGSLQGTGGYFPNLFRVVSWMFFLDDLPVLDKLLKPFHPKHQKSPFYKGDAFFKKAHQQDWVTGAFLLISKALFKKVGGFDEKYFMYMEDTDICYKVKKAGKEVWYLPEWSIVHLGGKSGSTEFTVLSEIAGVKRFLQKYYPAWHLYLARPILKLGMLLRIPIFGILDVKSAKIYAKAFWIA